MADIADEADGVIAGAIEQALSDARNAPPLPATGQCHNCQVPLSAPYRFCDGFCREDWQKREDAKRRTGAA